MTQQTAPMNSTTSDEAAIRAAVDRLLTAMGSYDLDAMPEMFMTGANIGVASLRDGEWVIRALGLEQFLTELRRESNPTHYTEPISILNVHVDQGRLGFVRADATLLVDDKAVRRNIDYFMLLKSEGAWKFVNASYVGVPADTA